MPHLRFYAFGSDARLVLDAVFARGDFRVFENASEEGHEIAEFLDADAAELDEWGTLSLELYVVGSGPTPLFERKGSRYRCAGWGLIQLQLNSVSTPQRLRASRTNHNSQTRATTWAAHYPALGDPADWDWKAVTNASAGLNRSIRSLGVGKLGPAVLLPQAAPIVEEYGAYGGI